MGWEGGWGGMTNEWDGGRESDRGEREREGWEMKEEERAEGGVKTAVPGLSK